MKLRTCLIASTALFTGSSAFASDLPETHKAIEYVQACDAFGAGYLQLPGKDTCLKLGGRIRTQVSSGNLTDGDASDYSAYARGYLWLDTKTQAESFTVSSYAGVYYTWKDSAEDGGAKSDDAFVQISNDNFDVLLGLADSLYSGFLGYAWMQMGGLGWSDTGGVQATLRIPVQNLTFGLSVQDSDYTGSSSGLNYIAAVEYSAPMVDLKLSGALVEREQVKFEYNDVEYDTGEEDEFGYAVNANAEISPTDNLTFAIGAQYGHGAAAFTGFSLANYGIADAIKPSDEKLSEVIDDNFDSLFNFYGGDSYSIMAAFSYGITDEVTLMVESAFTGFDVSYDIYDFDGSGFLVGSSLVWKPTPTLGIALTAGYNAYTSELTDGVETLSLDVEDAKIGTRVQYTF